MGDWYARLPETEEEKVYRASRGWTVFMWLAGPGLIALGLWGLDRLWRQHGPGKAIAETIFVAACVLGLAALGAASIVFIIRYRVRLKGDLLAVQGLVKYCEIRRSEVRGFRSKGDGVTTQLVPRDPTRSTIDVPIYFKADQVFWDWFDDLEDLDYAEMDGEEEEILSSEAYGATEERRANRLDQAITAARYLNGIGAGLAIWGWLLPSPYVVLMVLLLLTPLAAVELIRRYKGLIRFDGKESSVYPNVGTGLLLPSVILAYRAASDWAVLDAGYAVAWGAAIAAILLVLLIRFSGGAHTGWFAAACGFLLLWAYGYGAVVTVNCAWEPQRIEWIEAEVVDQRMTESSRYGTKYYLELTPWGPVTETEEIQVSSLEFRAVEESGAACIALRPGGLGLAWYSVHACER